LTFASKNTWQLHSRTSTGGRIEAALSYYPDSNRFIISMGYQRPDSLAYSEIMYTPTIGKWINFFPDNSLYGIWGDSTGNVRGLGKTGNSTFNSPYFVMKNVAYGGQNYLRPCLAHYRGSNVFTQFAVDTDDGKTYYFLSNMTITYSHRTRRWDTIGVQTHPAKIDGSPNTFSLQWGTMCYNPIQKEILLVGGGGLDTKNGSNGCWVFNISTQAWTKLNGTLPDPRAHTAMAYDARSGKIVLFGGDHLDFLFSDTWIYDCTTRLWEKKRPLKSPRPRAGHSLQYLPAQQALALFGGYEYTSCSSYSICGVYRPLPVGDLWTYNTLSNEWKLVKRFSGEKFPQFHSMRAIKAAADNEDKVLALGENDSIWQIDCDVSSAGETGTETYGVAPNTVYYREGPWVPSYFDEGLPSPDTAANEAFLRSVPENQWVNVSAPKRPRGNRDWGTSSLDPNNDLIIKYAGGHSAHCGTDVAVYSIRDNRWHISFSPEYPLDYTGDAAAPGIVSFGGNPWTSHSYDRYDFNTEIGKLVHMRNYYTYFFDPISMKWDTLRIRNHIDMTISGYQLSHTRTPHGTIVWSARGSSTSSFDLYRLDTDSMKWFKLPVSGPALMDNYSDQSGAVYDSKRDRLIMLHATTSTNPKLQAYNFSTGVVESIVPVNNNTITGVDRFRESVYIPDLDIVLYAVEIGGAKVIYDCAKNEWRLLNIPKGIGVGGTDSRSSGYMYDARRKLIWDSETNCQTYVLKLTNSHVGKESRSLTHADDVNIDVFPNPSNPTTLINFNIPSDGIVSIKLYSSNGREVKTMLNGVNLRAGNHSLPLSIVDNKGSKIASDFYAIRLEFGARTVSKKVFILK
ncbi:MAG: hypothetical protein JNL74_04625, partial [Fibrobacteres bacterium]|nr:hypothetical protein [Fibrobacterota bacterium]